MVKPPSFYRRENRAWYNVLSLRAERPVLRLAQNEIAHRAISIEVIIPHFTVKKQALPKI